MGSLNQNLGHDINRKCPSLYRKGNNEIYNNRKTWKWNFISITFLNVKIKTGKKEGRETTLRNLPALPLQCFKSERWLMLNIAYLEAVGTCCLIWGIIKVVILLWMKLLQNKQPHKASTSALLLYYSPLQFLFSFSVANKQTPETAVSRKHYWSNHTVTLLSFLRFCLFCFVNFVWLFSPFAL